MPVVAFVEDVAASGGYWLATAADEIWADENSIVGSIGVISAGFGFHEFIARYGIERRVHTAGRSKSMLDPFRPEQEDDVARLKEIQEQVHTRFIAQVRRGGARDWPRATGSSPATSGSGEAAHELGLVDGIGHLVPKMKERFGPTGQVRALRTAARAPRPVRDGPRAGALDGPRRAARLRPLRALSR